MNMTKKTLLPAPAPTTPFIAHMHRWKYSVLATAAFLTAGLYATDASALALGRLSVQSALGEPLRAEIALPRITPAEAESLRVAPASAEVFRAQGMEYSPAAHGIQAQLQRRPDGSMVLRLSSDGPINEPFVDIVLDATWSAGHLVRSYTMLLDPPALRRPQASVSAAPQVSSAAPARSQASRPATATAVTPRSASAAPAKPAASAAAGTEVAVKPGDTAGKIANAHRPEGVSLDQMLVALLRANPDAFINNNVNRLRAGAVLEVPSQADAQATAAPEARKLIAAQSHDFNAFRNRLAEAAPQAKVASAERSASGKVQTQVEEAKPAQDTPDKLKLSKGGIKSSKAEAEVAKDKQANQDAERMAELSKNISQLNELSEASKPDAAASAAKPADAAPGVSVPAPAGVPATEPAAPQTADAGAAAAPQAPAAATTDTAAPAEPAAEAAAAPAPTEPAGDAAAPAPAPAPAAAPAAPKPTPKPAPQPAPEEPSFIDSLLADPLLAGGGLAIILALLGYGGWRMVQQRRNQGGVDSSFLESRGHADSFFGASGGQRVDTASSVLTTGSSSMSYSPSQLDAGGDVDPVAEADVYLAYGRDLQAEEILKEALRHHPDRVSIPVKLAEIYAKRQDRKALEAVASDVYKLTDGQGPDWSRVSDLGRTLDPDNQLYQPGGSPAGGIAAVQPPVTPESNFPNTMGGSAGHVSPAPDSVLPDLDLHEAPPAPSTPSTFAAAAAASASVAARAVEPVASMDEPPTLEQALGDIDLPDSTFDTPAPTAVSAPIEIPVAHTEPSPLDAGDTGSGGLSLMDSAITPLTSRDAKPAVQESHEFDLGDLSLDLSAPSVAAAAPVAPPVQAKPATAADSLPNDPLATKLALAEEFNSIGDSEGARALVEEVIAESSGELKTRAQRLLADLG